MTETVYAARADVVRLSQRINHRALDAFEDAIRAEERAAALKPFLVAAAIWATDHINPSDAWVRDFIAAYEAANIDASGWPDTGRQRGSGRNDRDGGRGTREGQK